MITDDRGTSEARFLNYEINPSTRTEPPAPNWKLALPEPTVEPPDILFVEVPDALPGRPITGDHLVRPDGKTSLGYYGEVHVAGLTVKEIKAKIALHLRAFLDDQALGLISDQPFEQAPGAGRAVGDGKK